MNLQEIVKEELEAGTQNAGCWARDSRVRQMTYNHAAFIVENAIKNDCPDIDWEDLPNWANG